MAMPRAPDESDQPSRCDNEREYQQSLSPQNGDKGKEKKRVGFAGDSGGEASDTFGKRYQVTPNELQQNAQDYFTMSPNDDTDGTATSTPLRPGSPSIRDSFNRDELTAALTRILSPEHHGGSVPPSMPRPVLRKTAVLDSPADVHPAQHRSEVEAKYRADRLAFAVGSSSAPVSGRNSPSLPETPFDSEALLPGRSKSTVVRGARIQDFGDTSDSDGPSARGGAQEAATDLVRSHTRRVSSLSRPFVFPQSGTSTPLAHDLEYVPRPTKYKGGVLGSLLKLYNSDEKNGAESSAPSTPGWTTPSGTPPTSRPGTPKSERGRAGFRGMRSQSSSALAGLMETSLMFTAPGLKGISSAVSEKIRQEREGRQERDRSSKRQQRSKQKRDEFRITVHIAQIISRHQYLIKLCQTLMMYGAPTHRLENYMRMSARVLAIEGQFMYLPGTMIISFDDSDTHTTEVKIVRSPQGVDLGRLHDVHEIYKEVVHDLIGVEEATSRLNDVIGRRRKYPIWLRVLLFGVASAFVAPFGFEGRYIDMPICFLLGCLVGFLQLYLAPSNELYANVFEITAAIATSFLSRVFGSINSGKIFCFSALAQSSIALILPGYMVLCASLELQSHQMISGSVRMVYALIYSLFLGYGITIGSVIYGYIDDNAVSAVHCSTGATWYTQRPDPNYYILFVLPFTLCLCAINQAKWRQTPVMAVISLAGFCVSSFSSRHFQGNTTLSSSLGALCIGVLANLYSRLGQITQNYIVDIWERHFEPRIHRLFGRRKHKQRNWAYDPTNADSEEYVAKEDPEMGMASKPSLTRRAKKIGFGLAAAAMLPAIFVQVPSGLAVGGSLLSGVTNADQITRNETLLSNGTVINGTLTTTTQSGDLNSTSFNVLFGVIQVAISISVGLSLSALIVYPFGKRRSGLFSF